MRIAIEAQRIFRSNKHGMDFVALESIRELQKLDKENEYYIITGPGDDTGVLEETPNFKIVRINIGFYPIWEQIALPMALRKIKPDILHCTSNTAPVLGKTPLILTLHDIIFLEKRRGKSKSLYQNMGWYYRRLVVPIILKHCRKIITVSKYEAERIQTSLDLPQGKLTYVYNGFGKHFYHREHYYDITSKYLDAREFIFFLGNTDPKKNTERVLRSYSKYLERSQAKLPLLVADLKTEDLDSLLEINNIKGIREFIHCPGYIPNTHLPFVYSGAKVFLYPSLRESFGIPILEAMACSTPVITSSVSAMPEIAGNAAITVYPENEEQIAEALLNLEKDPALSADLITRGHERIKEFSWKKTAEQLHRIYSEYGFAEH